MIYKYIVAAIYLLTLSSCATIFNGKKQHILVNTYPVHAKVFNEGKELGTTPVIIEVKRKSKAPLIITSEGYVTKEVNLTRRFNPTSIYNFFNPYGWLIDWLTGSMNRFKETSSIQSLIPKNQENFIQRSENLDSIVHSDSTIFWSNNTKLQYKDFTGSISPKYKIFVASAHSTINCMYILTDTAAFVRVLTCFQKNNSFFKAKKDTRKEVLSHEQLHFDITEIISRRLRQQLSIQVYKKDNFENVLNKLMLNSYIELDSIQAQYDDEVYNSYNTISGAGTQNVWNKKIAEQLGSLDEFKANDVNVPLQ